MDVKHFCIFCGKTASIVWWKCCPKHTTERGPDVCCQTCAENLHSKEYLETESIQKENTPRDISGLVAQLREAADPTSIFYDRPWWWDCPDRGGPSQLLFSSLN